jgi:hypothetical protein
MKRVTLKIAYDLIIYANFLRVKPPEEMEKGHSRIDLTRFRETHISVRE